MTPIESHVQDCGSLETAWTVLIPHLYSEWENGLMYVVLKVVIHVMKYLKHVLTCNHPRIKIKYPYIWKICNSRTY